MSCCDRAQRSFSDNENEGPLSCSHAIGSALVMRTDIPSHVPIRTPPISRPPWGKARAASLHSLAILLITSGSYWTEGGNSETLPSSCPRGTLVSPIDSDAEIRQSHG